MISQVKNVSGAQLGGFLALCGIDGWHSVKSAGEWAGLESPSLLSVTGDLAGMNGRPSSSGMVDWRPGHGLSTWQSQGCRMSCIVAQSSQREYNKIQGVRLPNSWDLSLKSGTASPPLYSIRKQLQSLPRIHGRKQRFYLSTGETLKNLKTMFENNKTHKKLQKSTESSLYSSPSFPQW